MAGGAIYGAAGLLFRLWSAGGSNRQTFQPLPFPMHSCMIAVFSRDTLASCLSQSPIESAYMCGTNPQRGMMPSWNRSSS